MEDALMRKAAKRELWRRFSCSEAMLTLLNRASGYESKEIEEAADPLCGGILVELDCACGVLWGAALAAGVRASRRIDDHRVAQIAALLAAKECVDWYASAGKTVNCGEITRLKSWGMLKFMAKGNLRVCQGQLADNAADFHARIDEALEQAQSKKTAGALRNCASEAYRNTAKQIGLEVEDGDVIVAGLAGGIGLSGNGCGALAATVFAISLKYFLDRKKPKHSMLRSNLQGFQIGYGWTEPSRRVVESFREKFGTKMCSDITKTSFASPDELHAFLETGACSGVLDSLLQFSQAAMNEMRD